jgi:parallel beta-helix repeat protein
MGILSLLVNTRRLLGALGLQLTPKTANPGDAHTLWINSAASNRLYIGTAAVGTSYAVSVKDLGAIGDGVANDTAAIASAIATGQPVYIPAGNYKVLSTISLPSGCQLFGDGEVSRVFCPTADTNVFSSTAGTAVDIRDLWIDNTSSSASTDSLGWAVLVNAGSRVSIRNCRLSGYKGGVKLENSSDCRVSGCTVTAAIGSTNLTADIMIGCVVGNSSRNIIENNKCLSTGTQGILVRTYSVGDNALDNQIQGNLITSKTYYGIHLYKEFGNIERTIISQNTVRDISGSLQVNYPPLHRPGGAGIYSQGGEWSVISGNTLTATNASTDYEDHAPGAIGVSDTNCVIITNNTINAVSWYGIYVNDSGGTGNDKGSITIGQNIISNTGKDSYKFVQCSNIQVSGGSVSNITGYGVYVTNTTPHEGYIVSGLTVMNTSAAGIYLDAADSAIISDCTFYNFVSSGIHALNSDHVNIVSNIINSNSLTVTAIRIEASNTDVSIINNSGYSPGAASTGILDGVGSLCINNRFSTFATPYSGPYTGTSNVIGRMVIGADPGGSEPLRVGGNIRSNGTDFNFGGGGSGNANSIFAFNGSDATDYGAQIRLLRNSIVRGTLGTYGSIFGGNSSDTTIYTPSGYQIRFNVNGIDNIICGASGLITTGGAHIYKVRSVVSAASTTVLDGTDHIVVVTGSTTHTLTLPSAATGRVLIIKNRSTGNITVQRAGADTIDGNTSVLLNSGQSMTLIANSTDWVVV